MDTRDRLRKLSRYELVELIFELRKDNLELERRLREAEAQVAEYKAANARADLAERMDGLQSVLLEIRGMLSGERPGEE